MTTASAAAPQIEATRLSRKPLTSVAWFVGIMLTFAFIVTMAAVSSNAGPNLLAFPLAFARWVPRPRTIPSLTSASNTVCGRG